MRINYAIILASVSGVFGQFYGQGASDPCACLQTRSCVVNSPCLQREKVRKVKKPKTKRAPKNAACGACNGQGPCNSCQQGPAPVQKQYEAVPVFVGEPAVYRVVSSRQLQPGTRAYGAVPQVSQNQYASTMDYTYQQGQQLNSYPQQQYSTISQQFVQAPMQYAQAPLQQYAQAPLQQTGQAPCTNCGPAAAQNQRVYVPLKPNFWQRRAMKKSIKTTAARQPCAGPSCPGCTNCGGNNAYSQTVPQYYEIPQGGYQPFDASVGQPLLPAQPFMPAQPFVAAPLEVAAAPATATTVADSASVTLGNAVNDTIASITA